MKRRPERLVFIDETGTTTKMTRLRGRSRRGQRLRMTAPFGHWGTQTFIAALRHDGLTAPWVIDAPMNRRLFETYVETQLAPTLRPGDRFSADQVNNEMATRGDSKKSAVELATQSVDELGRFVQALQSGERGYVSRLIPAEQNSYGGEYDHLARVAEWSTAEAEEGAGDE